MRFAFVALVALGCTPRPYGAATSHTQTGDRSYIISVEGAHVEDALAVAYINRRAGELCSSGFDVLELDRLCGSVYSDVGRGHVRSLCSKPTHVAAVLCRWHGL
jgi:hypothetical protein